MLNTHIFLRDDLYEKLNIHSNILGMSISELICRTLEQHFKIDTVANARDFFDQLTPLESFSNVKPEDYVREIRSGSRLFRDTVNDT